ncbi:MAG TPA: maleylpyruvate isomerase family mycothiol-dependent enzyme [Frankiaceae bacterium]|nr:maleylpyruvate isomerase family mycothiol-dependent enzyme [Frankiaceae bacterium]
MAAPSPWPTIHAERTALADDLADLPDDRWSTPSLCSGWTVHEVLGHMVATAKMTPPLFLAKMASSGFRFSAMANKAVARETAGSPQDTLAELRRVAPSTSAPPGPVNSWLGETIVHGEDIRRPLGLGHQYPVDALVRVADFYKGSNALIGSKKRIDGVTLRATDAEWSHGDGPEVSGPMLSLLLAMTGRRAGLTDLTGAGVTTLRDRT